MIYNIDLTHENFQVISETSENEVMLYIYHEEYLLGTKLVNIKTDLGEGVLKWAVKSVLYYIPKVKSNK